jgi:hypothetical protein
VHLISSIFVSENSFQLVLTVPSRKVSVQDATSTFIKINVITVRTD